MNENSLFFGRSTESTKEHLVLVNGLLWRYRWTEIL